MSSDKLNNNSGVVASDLVDRVVLWPYSEASGIEGTAAEARQQRGGTYVDSAPVARLVNATDVPVPDAVSGFSAERMLHWPFEQ